MYEYTEINCGKFVNEQGLEKKIWKLMVKYRNFIQTDFVIPIQKLQTYNYKDRL
jgi:hypothetical protein